ncbi:MAG TPA: DUF3108 domain-containing protein [Saprospiraceae bacterium]|nr:DUF3108 domain-containing protein [Saprospiraceae bacterium]HQW55624.1 DUF3108 domain-containing protein [Saprospiraceae bacterium]
MLIKSALTFILFFFNSYLTPSVLLEADARSEVRGDCYIENNCFKDGEELRYNVYFNWGLLWLSAAEVVFKVDERPSGYYITARGKTYKSYEWLYQVDDRYEVMVDKKTLLPLWSIKHAQENDYHRYEKMVYNQDSKMVTSYEGPDEKNITTKVVSINECAHDILSIFYFMRNYEYNTFRSGKTIDINLFLDRKMNYLKAKYDGNVNNKVIKDLGVYNTFRISPETIEGQMFSSKKGSYMYVSRDNNQIPLLIESKLSVGSVKVVLNSVKNLRYPLTSRVK